jgi:peptidyl-prolyl cis-trans isomerase D
MLRGIHKASANWIGRAVMGVILGLIAISFGVWGIGDIFRGFGQSTLAKVGRTDIGIEQFRQIYNERLQELGRRSGRPITPDQARLFGLDRQILSQLLAETALDERARELGLALPESEIAKRITEDPTFRGFGGQFDHARFLQIIRQAGFTEQRYFAEQRRQLLRQQLIAAIAGAATVPKIYLEAYNGFQNEQRNIEYVSLDRSHAGQIPAPTAEVLAKYYEERKALFRAPEYRKLTMLVLTPAELTSTIEVSDADIKRAFEDRKARYVTPERRHVQQIMFQNAPEATAAADRIKKGLSFAALTAEPAIKDKYTDLGTIAKTAIIDPKIADAAFSLKPGAVSAPIEGRFGIALINVVKVEPGQSQAFEKVAPEIRREIALERAGREVQTMRDKVEDERLDNKTLEQAAQKLGLTLRTIEAVDRSGRDPEGKKIVDLPQGADVVAAAFRSEVGGENDALTVQGGGYVWYDVKGVTTSRDRPLDEVKAQVETRWRDDEIAARLKAKTTELIERLKTGAPMAQVATANKLKVQTAGALKRGNAVPGIPLRALNDVFRTAKGSAAVADGEAATDRIVFRVTDIVAAPFDPSTPETKRISEALQRGLAEDMLAQYMVRLQNEVGITINQSALNQITGAASSN